MRAAFVEAETALVLGDSAAASSAVGVARSSVESALAGRPELRIARSALAQAKRALAARDTRGVAAARATIWTAVLAASFSEATGAAQRGAVEEARSWLLVREFRPPTRFSRAAEDATLGLDALAAGNSTPREAAATIRRYLLDTYDSRLRSSLSAVADASLAGLAEQRAEAGALAQGYWRILRPSFVAQRGMPAARRIDALAEQLAAATITPGSASGERMAAALEGFRAAPLSEAETLRRAGQVERFLQLVPNPRRARSS